MNPVQKLIKLIADAIAVGLVVSIIGGIATVIFAVGGITSLKNEIKEIKANEEFTLYQADESINKISLNLLCCCLFKLSITEFHFLYMLINRKCAVKLANCFLNCFRILSINLCCNLFITC